MARNFCKMIFMGNGDLSLDNSNKLHERLEEGLSILSGLQQFRQDNNEFSSEIEDVVRDIAAALLGKEIEIGNVEVKVC